jgi:DNA-binding cell septation regulator SpoVG
MRTVAIEAIKPTNRPGATQAFVTFTANGIRVIDARIVNGSKGAFVALPQKSWEDREGKTRYTNLVEITDEALREEIQRQILEQWRKS